MIQIFEKSCLHKNLKLCLSKIFNLIIKHSGMNKAKIFILRKYNKMLKIKDRNLSGIKAIYSLR
jgi:hypothetical protein